MNTQPPQSKFEWDRIHSSCMKRVNKHTKFVCMIIIENNRWEVTKSIQLALTTAVVNIRWCNSVSSHFMCCWRLKFLIFFRYFQHLANSFESQMIFFRQQIEEMENYLNSLNLGVTLTPQGISFQYLLKLCYNMSLGIFPIL